MKRILTVQDLSCLGKCSLTVALPILSAMGVETSVLPTAVLSTHTAFSGPVVHDLSESHGAIVDHWQKIGAEFDGVYTGYMGSGQQVDTALMLAQRFAPGMLFVDPAMADHGKCYSGIDSRCIDKMKTLCAMADVIVPNLTEACLLTDTPYPQSYDAEAIKALLQKLTDRGCKVAMITGVCLEEGTVGVMGLDRTTGEYVFYSRQQLPESYHGTGDAFSAVCAGALLQGKTLQEAATLAAEFTAQCICATKEEKRDKRFGICFEKAIPWLIRKL